MNGIFFSFKPRDLTNSYSFARLQQVRDIFCEANPVSLTGLRDDCVILEDFGSWLGQTSYHDEGGHFIKFRMTPIWAHLPKSQEAAKRVLEAFTGLFPGARGVDIHGREEIERGGTGVITCVVRTSLNSIGD